MTFEIFMFAALGFIFFMMFRRKKNDDAEAPFRSVTSEEIENCSPHSWIKLEDKIDGNVIDRFKKLTKDKLDNDNLFVHVTNRLLCNKCGYITGTDFAAQIKNLEQMMTDYIKAQDAIDERRRRLDERSSIT